MYCPLCGKETAMISAEQHHACEIRIYECDGCHKFIAEKDFGGGDLRWEIFYGPRQKE